MTARMQKSPRTWAGPAIKEETAGTLTDRAQPPSYAMGIKSPITAERLMTPAERDQRRESAQATARCHAGLLFARGLPVMKSTVRAPGVG